MNDLLNQINAVYGRKENIQQLLKHFGQTEKINEDYKDLCGIDEYGSSKINQPILDDFTEFNKFIGYAKQKYIDSVKLEKLVNDIKNSNNNKLHTKIDELINEIKDKDEYIYPLRAKIIKAFNFKSDLFDVGSNGLIGTLIELVSHFVKNITGCIREIFLLSLSLNKELTPNDIITFTNKYGSTTKFTIYGDITNDIKMNNSLILSLLYICPLISFLVPPNNYKFKKEHMKSKLVCGGIQFYENVTNEIKNVCNELGIGELFNKNINYSSESVIEGEMQKWIYDTFTDDTLKKYYANINDKVQIVEKYKLFANDSLGQKLKPIGTFSEFIEKQIYNGKITHAGLDPKHLGNNILKSHVGYKDANFITNLNDYINGENPKEYVKIQLFIRYSLFEYEILKYKKLEEKK